MASMLTSPSKHNCSNYDWLSTLSNIQWVHHSDQHVHSCIFLLNAVNNKQVVSTSEVTKRTPPESDWES